MLTALNGVPSALLIVTLGMLNVAESGLLIGVLLPGGSAVIMLGGLVDSDQLVFVAVAVAAASLSGGILGYFRARSIGACCPPAGCVD